MLFTYIYKLNKLIYISEQQKYKIYTKIYKTYNMHILYNNLNIQGCLFHLNL